MPDFDYEKPLKTQKTPRNLKEDSRFEWESESSSEESPKAEDVIDVYEMSGRLHKRVDVKKILQENQLTLLKIRHVIFPRLKWSDRRFESSEGAQKQPIRKSIVIGDCSVRGIASPFLLKLDLETARAEILKVLQDCAEVTAINFGPYDNNYLLVGLRNGFLLVYDVLEMERVASLNLFQNDAISQISYEPTNLIFAAS